jgi:hypothetical protein
LRGRALDPIITHLFRATLELFEREDVRSVIEAVAEALLARETLSFDEACALVPIHLHPQAAPSGGAP